MSLDEGPHGAPSPAAGARPDGDRVLEQREIDALTGFSPAARTTSGTGVRAIAEGDAVSNGPLPMLSVVIERLAERLSGALRRVFGCDVEVRLRSLDQRRYGEFVDDTVLPSQIVLFRAVEWGGRGLVALGPDLALVVLDGLLGAGRTMAQPRPAVRPFTAIESAILSRFVSLVLGEAAAAFGELSPVSFAVERLEPDPRLAAIARPADAVHVARLEVDLDGRGAPLLLCLPAATLEPVRALLRRSFMGVAGERGSGWSCHLAGALWRSQVEAEAVLHEVRLPLRRVLDLGIGDTLMFDLKPTDLVTVRHEGRTLTRGRMGRVDGRIAVQVAEPVRLAADPAGGAPA